MRRRWWSWLTLLAASLVMMLTAPSPALAQTDGATSALCADHAKPCAVQLDGTVRESAYIDVTVLGAPGTSTSVQAYRVTLNGDRIDGLTAYSSATPARLGPTGVARSGVGLPALPDSATGGFVFVSLAGMADTDVSRMVGSFAVLGAASPMLLGDGYADQKPVGQVLDLQYYAAIPASRFAVDQQADDGSWHEVTAQAQPGDLAMSADSIGHVRYTVPRGLQQKAYTFRLRNTTVNRVVSTWTVIPSLNPASQNRAGVWTPPRPGSAIGNATSVQSHDSRFVEGFAAGVVLVCLAICALSGLGVARTRRRAWVAAS